MSVSRREFVNRVALTGAGVLVTGSAEALASAPGAVAVPQGGSSAVGETTALGYGPLVPDPDGILALPEGFTYRVVTYSGRTVLRTGEPTPSNHDGTAAFPRPDGGALLVNNHELMGPRADWAHPVPLLENHVYDPGAAGGCTVVEVDEDGTPLGEWVGIAGTSSNCAGGRTPWGTWLTCEETEDLAGTNGMTKDHGYVFEVDPYHPGANLHPEPIKALGRFAHEAVVIDPKRGHAYLTEDARRPNGLLYRWTPPAGFRHGRGRLRALADDAGVLEAFKVFDNRGKHVDDLSRATEVGTVYGVDWVRVPDRDARTVPIRQQFTDTEVTRARKLEGMWWGDGGFYFVSSYARSESPVPHDGQVWFYNPARRTIILKVMFTGNHEVWTDNGNFDGPDNITVSPHGGLIIAEDGLGYQHLFGTTDDGRTYPLARNEFNVGTADEPSYAEFTGVTFSADGRTLFANIYEPGIMLAITGPWETARRH
ncbi:Tat pathway signal sequence domain protein [Streptomyces sp. Ru62]|uniref:alkaline phosphatase PhoX n=1 Tax=Streptomyces sp. Ru62 TaxID=2080745 RepID=UPI000CDE4E93|nr:alkaline phosphatase PhoX [Streptomyces sp. Ru62]POX64467.1 Tat pathway signal sequence domain protein [Streptomyces sp. Ru62]